MNDVKDLLGLALDTAPTVDTPVDPREDLARGRRLLRRRRLVAGAGVAAAMVVGAAVPLALQGGGGVPSGHVPVAVSSKPVTKTTKPSPSSSGGGHVALVAWTGTQPPGYEVSWMPEGWVVQGSTPYYLTIAPAGDKDTQPDSFLGKLVVMLQSKSVTSPPSGQSQPVNGRRGVFEPGLGSGRGHGGLDLPGAGRSVGRRSGADGTGLVQSAARSVRRGRQGAGDSSAGCGLRTGGRRGMP